MKTTRQTSTMILFLGWLMLLPLGSQLVAQSFYTAEEALEEIEYQADEVRSQTLRSEKLIAALRQSAEDGDFRGQDKTFKKLHAHLVVIEEQAYAISRYSADARSLDPRLETSRLREYTVHIGTQLQYGDLALRDAAFLLHEGKLEDASISLREAKMVLGAIRIFAHSISDEARMLRRAM